MLVLGLETSCDETSVALVEDGIRILSNTVASQTALHRAYGGIVPEIACRAHTSAFLPALETALKQAGKTLKDVDAVAATNAPGLVGSLLVGLTAGKTLAWTLGKPFVAVNHLAAHLHAAQMADPAAPYPAVTLLASGGHTASISARPTGTTGRGPHWTTRREAFTRPPRSCLWAIREAIDRLSREGSEGRAL